MDIADVDSPVRSQPIRNLPQFLALQDCPHRPGRQRFFDDWNGLRPGREATQ